MSLGLSVLIAITAARDMPREQRRLPKRCSLAVRDQAAACPVGRRMEGARADR
jgi:hypothetical protein